MRLRFFFIWRFGGSIEDIICRYMNEAAIIFPRSSGEHTYSDGIDQVRHFFFGFGLVDGRVGRAIDAELRMILFKDVRYGRGVLNRQVLFRQENKFMLRMLLNQLS